VKLAAIAVGAVAGVTALAAFAFHASGGSGAYTVQRLVSDGGVPARYRASKLVNAWGIAAEPGGVWWTANEASDTSTVFSSAGKRQLLTVAVPGGPTGVVFNPGRGFVLSAGGKSDPARFIFACEDGTIRAWTPTVPTAWSSQSEIGADLRGQATVFRGLALTNRFLYATDFHNGRVEVFDRRWRNVRLPGGFSDPNIPPWYAPFGIAALGGHLFVTYVYRAPVDGNDAPTGGFVDEFDGRGRLVARVAHRGPLNAPWGLALAPKSFGHFGGDLIVGNFGDGRVNAFRKVDGRWEYDGAVRGSNGKPLELNGLWALAFDGHGRLFFSSGPHAWRGATELRVHGLVGSITPA
jgi:uncharacterized protein (TIGR03118 family)